MLVFKNPTTTVNERLDEIAVMVRDWKSFDYHWPAMDDIAWLRSVFAQFWNPDYPQPYIGTGPEDAMISLYWKTVEWTFTLEVDTASKTGYLCRSPNQAIGEAELAVDVDLTSRDTWAQIASELGVEVDRTGKVLAAGLGQSISRRRNTGSRISTQNKPSTTRIIVRRAGFRKRSKSGSIARLTLVTTVKSGSATTSGRYLLHISRVGSGRRYVGVRTGTG